VTQSLVSIIIPTYNRAHLIGETLDSVLAQTYQNWECIVVDDGSSDNTDIIIKRYIDKDSRFQYCQRPKNLPKGGNAARNYGFELSKGDYIQWFDDDDVMLPGYLLKRIQLFDEAIDVVICTGYKVNNQLEQKEIVPIAKTTNLFKDYALRKVRVLTPSVLFKRQFLLDKDLFLTDRVRGQETELFLRLFYMIQPTQYHIIGEPLFLYRQHESTKSTKGKRYHFEFIEGQTKAFLATLEKGFALKDKELVLFYYKLLLNYYRTGFKKRHFSNCKLILEGILKLLTLRQMRLRFEMSIIFNFFKLIYQPLPKRLHNYFLNHSSLRDLFS
jgi:glycosyltransferase involved in cell wall biosynthesis